MMVTNRKRSMVAGAFCVALLVSIALPAGAAPGRYAMQPGMTQMFLSVAGVETDAVVLSRGDDISRALYIPNLRGNDVIIGFPDAGIGLDVPFLLSINGEELMVEATTGGGLAVLEGDPTVLPADIGDFIDCLVNNIVDLARAIIELNIGGIIGNVLQLVGCIFQIL
jgi:hypothetical protein